MDREEEQSTVDQALFGGDASTNLFLNGPRGSGKTALARVAARNPDSLLTTCYVLCSQFDSAYKVLSKVHQSVTGEDLGTGYHVSDLQRRIEERTDQINTVVILDQIEFLIQNDGDDVLYYLSRIKHSDQVGIVAISDTIDDLRPMIEKRAYSTFRPQTIQFDQYTVEEANQILNQRADEALKTGSFDEGALSYIANTTQNLTFGLIWLETAAEALEMVNEETAEQAKSDAYRRYVGHILHGFSDHHRMLYYVIEQLTVDTERVNTGDVYDRYQTLCRENEVSVLSDRRISDYLKHLELLDLISAEYHYGGLKGKTREIALNHYKS